MNLDNDEDALGFINRLLERLHQADFINHGSKIELVYVASGGQHVETQINIGAHPSPSNEREIAAEDKTPSPEVMTKAVEKTINDGLWATSTCWSVVYIVYRILGYEGSINDFVREVESWKFAKPVRYKCNRDSVGKPLRNKKMTYNIYNWQSDGVQKSFYLLALALLEEIKRKSSSRLFP